jgi:hypothetical protein
VARHHLPDARPARLYLLDGGPAVGRRRHGPGLDLLAEARDPDLEELVEVRGEDRQEAGPFQERVAGVTGLVEHPRVEVEPGQLAVDVGERSVGLAPLGAAALIAEGETSGRHGRRLAARR